MTEDPRETSPHARGEAADALRQGQSADRSFDEARAETDAVRDALGEMRRDIEVLVRREVGRSAADPRRLEALVRDAVRREVRGALDARTPWLIAQIGWLAPVLGVAVGLALGLSAYAAISLRRAANVAPPTAMTLDTGTTPATLADAAAAGASAAAPAAPGIGPDPAARAAAYDTLLASASPVLDPIVARLEAAGPSGGVRTVIAAYRLGQLTPDQAERLHAALVQLTLRDRVQPALALDGQILRGPCRGASCGALLEYWKSAPPGAGLPAYADAVASDTEAVRSVERVLVAEALHELVVSGLPSDTSESATAGS